MKMPEQNPSPEQEREKVSIALNPLLWAEADETLAGITGQKPSADNLLSFLRGPFVQATLGEFVERYREASLLDRSLFAVPTHERILGGIFLPIHNAKSAFILGHFASCVSLCGLAGEMLTVFRFDVAEIRLGGSPLDSTSQKLLWGRVFDRLPQTRRVSALRALGLIDLPTEQMFARVAERRNKYLHTLQLDHSKALEDARHSYKEIARLTQTLLGIGMEGQTLTVSPDVMRFIRRQTSGADA